MINKTTGGCNHLWLENILTRLLPRDLIFRMMASNGTPVANDASTQSAPWEYSDAACSTFLSHLSFGSGFSPFQRSDLHLGQICGMYPLAGDPTVTAFPAFDRIPQ